LWRKQDNWSGRWTSPDPYGGSMTTANPQSFNRYTYCENDPADATDRSGLLENWGADHAWSDVDPGFWGKGDFNNRPHDSERQRIWEEFHHDVRYIVRMWWDSHDDILVSHTDIIYLHSIPKYLATHFGGLFGDWSRPRFRQTGEGEGEGEVEGEGEGEGEGPFTDPKWGDKERERMLEELGIEPPIDKVQLPEDKIPRPIPWPAARPPKPPVLAEGPTRALVNDVLNGNASLDSLTISQREEAAEYYEAVAPTTRGTYSNGTMLFNYARADYLRNGGIAPGTYNQWALRNGIR
jgi:hypothetical protein